MGLIQSTINTIESVLDWASRSVGQNLDTYCMLETADDRHTLVMKDGTLVSIIKLDGTRQVTGNAEFDLIHDRLTSSLRAYMSGRSHAIQVYFERDKDGIEREIRKATKPAVSTAEAIGIDVSDLIDDQVREMSKHCSVENTYFVLFTKVNGMTKNDIKREAERKKVVYAKTSPAVDAQNLALAIPAIRDRHFAFVSALMSDMAGAGLAVNLLDVHTAVREVRMTVDKDFTSDTWTPYLPGDKIPARVLNNPGRDISDLMWPKLTAQIFPRGGDAIEHQYYRVGSKIYAPIFIEMPPKELRTFTALFNRIAETKIPWRASFLIESGGLDAIRIKALWASIVGFSNAGNKLLLEAKDALEEEVLRLGEADVKLRISFSTWVSNGNLEDLRSRASQLARAVEGWGECEVTEVSGDPVAGVLSSALGMSLHSVAPAAAAPLSDVTHMLPIVRPASPWSEGAVMWRTTDGKLWPYQPGSSLQTTWVDLTLSKPGSGKSVLLNKINMACCLAPGKTTLPRILIIDIGSSSSGLISLIRSYLPEDQKHLAECYRMQMTPEWAINPFDTELGCRSPIGQHRAFLVNFLTLLATPVGKQHAYDGIPDMTGLVVDEVYRMVSDEGNAKPYVADIDSQVDEAIKRFGFPIDNKSTWWEIVDSLFACGDILNATRAQRHAMPVLSDVIQASRVEAVRNLYSKMKAPTGEDIVEAFERMISSAIREYPILSKPTVFDASSARIVSIDLDDVAKSGGDAADRQTAIMYMLSRSLARDYYVNQHVLPQVPEAYRPYHAERIDNKKEDLKKICFDEFHRTKAAQAVRDQVEVDIREGRKHGVHVSLLSQDINDFTENMIKMSTAIFVLDGGTQLAVDELTRILGLSETAQYALSHRVHGPKPGVGATFLASFALKSGNCVQLVTNTLGAIEYWAFSTTAEDMVVRDALYAQIGAKEARKLLATLYPYGVQREVELRRNQQVGDGDFINKDAAQQSVLKTLIKEIAEIYYKQQRGDAKK